MVFGVNCSPFILGAVLAYHCKNVSKEDSTCASKLIKSMYVDNCVTSVETHEEYLHFKEQTTKILADCGMQLRQWEYSYQGDDENSEDNKICKKETSKVLGMQWNKKKDTLSCNISEVELSEVLTKRVVL